ncbi:MAG: hypothetical protein O3A80_00270 [bacterium]|nr:hypothetical protein [bacterium]
MTKRARESSSDSSSVIISRRHFLAATASLPILAGCASQSFEITEEELAEVRSAIEEYRTALQGCLETPSQDTAETLNRASMLANSMYFIIQPDLTVSQKLDVGVQVGDLNGRAIDAVNAVEPKNRYTKHYLSRIKDWKVTFTLQSIGDQEGARKHLEEQIEEAKNNVTANMSSEEQVEYMSQLVDAEE